jgi:hypothetical protein
MEAHLKSTDPIAVIVGPKHLAHPVLGPYLNKYCIMHPISPFPLISDHFILLINFNDIDNKKTMTLVIG